jgi:2-haloalkanoic acid dehalogenase type II
VTGAPLGGVKACVFDAYGTVFDFASAAARCTDALGDVAVRLTTLWRDKQLQYSWLRAAQDRHADFWQVTGDALDFALETLGLVEPGLRDRLMQLYLALDPFPEVADVLRQLRSAGFSTAILSNGSSEMLAPAIDNAGLAGLFDHVLSVDGRGLQAAPQSLPARLRPARRGRGCHCLSVLQRVGRARRLGLRDEDRLVQPLWPDARTPARPTRPRDPVALRTAAARCRLTHRHRTRVDFFRPAL